MRASRNSIRSLTKNEELRNAKRSPSKINVLALRRSSIKKSSIEPAEPSQQVQKLLSCFPDIPLKMLECLIVKNNGNCSKVFKYLVSKGWEARGATKKAFDNVQADQFTVAYYHGQFSKKVQKKVQSSKPGSYLTYYKYTSETNLNNDSTTKVCQYFLRFKNADGNVEEKKVNDLSIPELVLCALGLDKGITCETKSLSFIPGIEQSL